MVLHITGLRVKIITLSCYIAFKQSILCHVVSMERPQFTNQQRAFMVTEYHRTNNVTAVCQRFRTDLNRGRSGRLRTGRSAENIEAVHQAIQDHQDGDISCHL